MVAAPAEGENAVRLAGKPDAAAARPATRGRSALGDVSNQQRVPIAGAKPVVSGGLGRDEQHPGASVAVREGRSGPRRVVVRRPPWGEW